jgi:hypothetical protein
MQVETAAIDENANLSPEDRAVSKSPLFRLPPELRRTIFSHCLVSRYPILWPSDNCRTGLTPALLATCKKIYGETAPLLYMHNTLHFTHPSDCNMFLWNHNERCAREIRSILLSVADCKDVRHIWTGYLSSSHSYRSLVNDYPELEVLHITLQSRFWELLPGDVIDKYRRWHGDRGLKELAASLEGRVREGADIKILVVQRVVRRDIAALKQAYPRDLLMVRGGRGEVRTRWVNLYRVDVALELVPREEIAGP